MSLTCSNVKRVEIATEILLEGITFYTERLRLRDDLRKNKIIEASHSSASLYRYSANEVSAGGVRGAQLRTGGCWVVTNCS